MTLAVALVDVAIWAVTLAGMAAIGVVAWKALTRQEANDPSFRAKLDADDARAERGEG